MKEPCVGVALEDLSRRVPRTVVCRNHEVDADGEVESDLGVEDVGLVAGEQCHYDLHAGRDTSASNRRAYALLGEGIGGRSLRSSPIEMTTPASEIQVRGSRGGRRSFESGNGAGGGAERLLLPRDPRSQAR